MRVGRSCFRLWIYKIRIVLAHRYWKRKHTLLRNDDFSGDFSWYCRLMHLMCCSTAFAAISLLQVCVAAAGTCSQDVLVCEALSVVRLV